MRLVYLAAGAGQMYCGACARDVVLVRGLIARGHDVQVIPLYTPLRVEGDEPFPTQAVFMGGINAFLQQRFAFFRRLPPALDRILDLPALLRFVSRFALSTKASELGEMTVSVLAGRDGQQNKELERLVAHLKGEGLPDAFVITNSLLSGLAPELKRQFGVPVLCGLQGEDSFVGSMPERYRSQAHDLMRRNAEAVDLFIAPSQGYGLRMAQLLAVDPARVRTVPTGLDVAPYRSQAPRVREPFTVGYLSVITPVKGLDLLVEACRKLAREGGRELRLRVAGRVLDKRYWGQVSRSVARAGLSPRFEYLGEVDLAEKHDFLRGCSVLVLPSRTEEARGLVVMEALAAGVPALAPATGVFPELLARFPDLLFPPGDVEELARRLERLMLEPEEADRLGREGGQMVATEFSPEGAVEEMLGVLQGLVGREPEAPATDAAP